MDAGTFYEMDGNFVLPDPEWKALYAAIENDNADSFALIYYKREMGPHTRTCYSMDKSGNEDNRYWGYREDREILGDRYDYMYCGNLFCKLSIWCTEKNANACLSFMKAIKTMAYQRLWARVLINFRGISVACVKEFQQLFQFFDWNPGIRKFIGAKILLFCDETSAISNETTDDSSDEDETTDCTTSSEW